MHVAHVRKELRPLTRSTGSASNDCCWPILPLHGRPLLLGPGQRPQTRARQQTINGENRPEAVLVGDQSKKPGTWPGSLIKSQQRTLSTPITLETEALARGRGVCLR